MFFREFSKNFKNKQFFRTFPQKMHNVIFFKNLQILDSTSVTLMKMASLQTFSRKMSNYFRTLTGNIFLRVFCWCWAFVARKRDNFAKVFLKILPFLSTSRKISVVKFFSLTMSCILWSWNIIERELQHKFFWIISSFIGAAKHSNEKNCNAV